MFPITISVTINSTDELVKLQALTALAADPKADKSRDVPAKTEVKAEDKPAKKQVAAPSPAPAVDTPPTATEAAVAAPEPKVEAIKYEVLQKAVFTLAGKSRDAASAVAAGFGVKTFKELDQSKWAEALAAVNAKIEELGA